MKIKLIVYNLKHCSVQNINVDLDNKNVIDVKIESGELIVVFKEKENDPT